MQGQAVRTMLGASAMFRESPRLRAKSSRGLRSAAFGLYPNKPRIQSNSLQGAPGAARGPMFLPSSRRLGWHKPRARFRRPLTPAAPSCC